MVSLDSSYLIDLLDGDLAAVRKGVELDATREEKFVTGPAAAEVLVGGYHLGGRSLERARKLVDGLALLPFDRAAYHEAARLGAILLQRGTPVGQSCLFIAAISHRHGEAVLTRDRTFARIPDVKISSY